ncbi:MAG: MBOAT family protein, partial [Verrucomicrobiae bacterium]|nr:MBOAT family protein [Verrucomicrobiae bacterium]
GELTFQILLPVGISFYVFQSSAYVIDTYRGRVQPTNDFLDYALFVSFFPQLVAGPIERASHLLGILQSPRRIDAARFQGAFLLLLWGFFLKLVVADNAAAICNRLFSIEATQFPLLWAGVFAFGVQIYADFWAYTTIARGSARLLGIDLVHNFDHPYSAASPAEFWRRWHISLSTWFRDYVYIPLGGSRGGIAMECRNLLATFALSGLWHGASWNFIIWGIYHGILVSGQRLLENRGWLKNRSTNGWIRMGKWLATFVLIHIGWLFFREHNSDYLWRYLRLDPFDGPTLLHWQGGLQEVLVVGVYALPLWLAPVTQSWWERSGQWRIGQLPGFGQFSLTLAAALGLFVLILILGNDVSSDFIYFQF